MKPKVIEVEVSRRCNLRCALCPIRRHPGNPYLLPGMFGKILDTFPTVEEIYLIGNGEPLLNPHLTDILKLARDRIRVGLTTNGMLIDRRIVDTWKELGIWKVYVSLDSMKQDLLNTLRPGASVSKIKEAIKLLGGSGIKTRVNTLRYRANGDELEAISKFCEENGAVHKIIGPFYTEDKEDDPTVGRPSPPIPINRTPYCQSQFYITIEGNVYTCPFVVIFSNNGTIREYLNRRKHEAPLSSFLLGTITDFSPKKNIPFCSSCSVRLGISCQV